MSTCELEFPHLVDSTMRASFKACPQKFFWEWMRRLTLMEKSPDLLAGGAFAKGMEVTRREFYGNNLDAETAITRGAIAIMDFFGDYEPPSSNPKTCERMIGAFQDYFDTYPLATDYIQPLMTPNGPAIEITFAIELPGTRHPTTDMPILYGGRYDMIAKHLKYDALYVEDEKTTKQLGSTWADKWSLRGQFLGYMRGAIEYGFPVAGAIIRGISILKTKYGHAEAIVSAQEWMIEQYMEQVVRDVKAMRRHWEENFWDKAFDESCNSFGSCPMKKLCLSPDPERWTSMLYRRNNWNPLAKNPEEPTEAEKDIILEDGRPNT